ncbi:protein regulator of cytokinesis 1-like isoform X3 [Ostrea edulis]|uniref:protein regulator of cytokinesis 1-like isoform X3 n=1 Tax=Ostrea edulis TaxID=37623 RepID=UPI0024AF361C|nr:protein regulator of cytokinesis 1-like isoform X3 [Ostrea edulis]
MATNGRMSVVDDLVKFLDTSMSKLHRIWSEIGIVDYQRKERAQTAMLHLQNLLKDMVQEEEALKHQITKRIDKYTQEVKSLCTELEIPQFEPNGKLSMLQREKDLRAKAESLTQEKQERLKTLKHLKDQDQYLCDAMCLTPYYIPTGSTPSIEQLKSLEQHVNSLKAEKEKRFKEFVSKKKQIVELCREVDRNPQSDFECEVLCEEDNTFLLSTENMKSLKVLLTELEEQKEDMQKEVGDLWERIDCLWDRLEISEAERSQFRKDKSGFKPSLIETLKAEIARCEKLKFENIQRFVEGMRKEIVEWWDKCFYSREQRENFTAYFNEHYTEAVLEEHDKELQKLKTHYKDYKQMFESLEKWDSYFRQMIEMERKANDPNRFNNRGGKLLQEEKARKKVLKDLPRIEEELKESVIRWEADNGRPFLVEGVALDEYVQRQWIAYEEQKVKEKEQRHKAKARLMEEEMIYGSKPSTPAKKRFLTTPTKTPSKLRKLNDTTKTPMSCSKIQHSSVFASPSMRAPMSASKYTPGCKTTRRRSLRGNRKVLSERNTGPPNSALFSHTTVSSHGHTAPAAHNDVSMASMGTYQDFERNLNQPARASCRSSMMPRGSPSK